MVRENSLEINPEVVVLRAVNVCRPGGYVDCLILHFIDVVDYALPSAAAVVVADEVWAFSDVGHVVYCREWMLGLLFEGQCRWGERVNIRTRRAGDGAD